MSKFKYEVEVKEVISGEITADNELQAEEKIATLDLGDITETKNIRISNIIKLEEEEKEQKPQESSIFVTLYTTHCPKCVIIERKLRENNIPFEEYTNKDEMIAMGLKSVPWIRINAGELIGFREALSWLNGLGGGN